VRDGCQGGWAVGKRLEAFWWKFNEGLEVAIEVGGFHRAMVTPGEAVE
jgi:hypothetical protein